MKRQNSSSNELSSFNELGIKPNKNALSHGKNTTWYHTWTPKQASSVLESKNDINRKQDVQIIEILATQILNNTYNPSARTIKLSEKQLLDGQHFLEAVIKANKEVVALTTNGYSENDIKNIDTGKNRTASNMIEIEGKKRKDAFLMENHVLLSRMLKHYDAYDKIGVKALGVKADLGNRKLPISNLYEHLEDTKLMNSFKDTMSELENISDICRNKLGPEFNYDSVIKKQVAHVLFQIIKESHGLKIARIFFTELFLGLDRLYSVRNYIIKRRESLKAYDINYSASYYIMSNVFKAWRKNKPITSDMYELTPKQEKQPIYSNISF